MSGPVGSSTWFGEPGYNLNQSLRFEDTAKNGTGSYLTKTPDSAGNSDLWTYSCWAKGLPAPNANSHQTQILLGVDGNDSNDYYLWLSISNDGTFDFRQIDSGGYDWRKISTALFRDPSAWYHFMVAYDSANGTAEDRIKMYVNGERITSFGTNANPDQNKDAFVNKTKIHTIGRFAYNGEVQGGALNGYLAEVNLIDGAAKVPADFGTTGAFGEWIPIQYDGAYGTNGFYLNFAGGGIISATGGTITTDGDYKVHSFTADGTFTPTSVPATNNYVEYLVIAGGGSGGSNHGGGGGAGGYRTGVLTVTAQAYSITVGDGGAAVTGTSVRGNNGANSVFSSITSTGGGGGGSYDGTKPGIAGGSGGGGATGSGAGGSGTAGQGNDGGTGTAYAAPHYAGGGGGGAGAVGTAGGTSTGGAGLASSITGSSVTRAGGGGGASDSNQNAAGGSGGGGASGKPGAGVAGTANTGSGGGGSHVPNATGAGGSGIVIIRYRFQ